MQLLVKASPNEQKTKILEEASSSPAPLVSSSNKELKSENISEDDKKLRQDLIQQEFKFARSEDLVLRILESELDGRLERNVKIGGESKMVYFDGVFVDSSKVIAVEVKLLRSPEKRIELLGTIIRQAEKLREIAHAHYLDFKLILAVVHNFGDEEEHSIYEDLTKKIGESKIKSEIRLYGLKKLWKRYGNT